MKDNHGKTKVIVSSGITKDGLSKIKVDPCGMCCLRSKANSVLCVQCGKWTHGRCVREKRVTAKFSRKLACRKCKWNVGEAVEQEKRLCDEVQTIREFTYLGDRVSAGEGCEAAVTVRTRCGWHKLRECSELQYGRRLPPKLNEAVCKSYVRPAILYGSESWHLKESEMGII